MSSDRRPWFPWYPKDFVVDEKVQALSDDAELLYRRALDVLWQANALQLPSNCQKLANILARNWDDERFKKAWDEIQYPGFELFKTTDDGLWVYSSRLRREAEKIENISKKRSKLGKKGGVAKAKQLPSNCLSKSLAKAKQRLSHTDPYTDIYKTPLPPFEIFWRAYPKKVGKDAAKKAFEKRKKDLPAIDSLVSILAQQIKTSSWTKDGGQFIPNPATYLNQGRWKDEIDKPPETDNEFTKYRRLD